MQIKLRRFDQRFNDPAYLGDLLRGERDRVNAAAIVAMGGKKLSHISLDPELEDVWVPSLILQPLVENAVRHGVEPRRGIVVVRVAARVRGERVHLTVEDEGDAAAPAPKATNDQGIGLRNTRSRLLQLYDGSAEMNVSSIDAAYRVTIVLPIRTTPSPSSR